MAKNVALQNCPAALVIEKMGGHARVAQLRGIDESQVYRWTYPRSNGGTDGQVPTRHHRPLLEKARELGLPLEPADFFETPSQASAA